jgi:hypothetical protein
VTNQDKIIHFIIQIFIVSFGFHFLTDKYNLNNHIQKIAHIVIWVEETGSHKVEASSTVVAAESAIQNALIWSI